MQILHLYGDRILLRKKKMDLLLLVGVMIILLECMMLGNIFECFFYCECVFFRLIVRVYSIHGWYFISSLLAWLSSLSFFYLPLLKYLVDCLFFFIYLYFLSHSYFQRYLWRTSKTIIPSQTPSAKKNKTKNETRIILTLYYPSSQPVMTFSYQAFISSKNPPVKHVETDTQTA
jgi:hypothetical protein